MNNIKRIAVVVGSLAAILVLVLVGMRMLNKPILAGADGQSGTTLSADKTASGYTERIITWSINKSVSPSSWDLFQGDSGTSQYTVSVTKNVVTKKVVSGQICVTNGGSFATENLKIVDEVQYKVGGGQFQTLTSADVDLSSKPILEAGESYCYPYKVEFTPVEGAQYRNVAHVTITNHAGWLPGGHNCPGPDVCPFGPDPKTDFSITGLVTTGAESINVTDTNGGSWTFNDSGTQTYPKTFSCSDIPTGEYSSTHTYTNIATITTPNIPETGLSDEASVTVNCYALKVEKTANTSYTRTYNWMISKEADQTSLTLSTGQIFGPVNYIVTANATYTDSDWAANGNITITNPSPTIPATINSLADVITTGINANVNCNVTFPYSLPANGTLQCSYTASLPDATTRTNKAIATLQNYNYDPQKNPTPNGTTNFYGEALIDFSSATITKVDECADVSDSLQGSLGGVCYSEVPKTFQYTRNIGPYANCGDYSVVNTSTLTTRDTKTTKNASWTISVHVPCAIGCTLTIGYWKTHAGFGPGRQADMVTKFLPIWLGTSSGAKSINVTTAALAVQLLSFKGWNNVFDASNGINKLYAQLLGAKLNIANGASSSAISSTIVAADSFLATHNSTDWNSLIRTDKQNVLRWMTTLDNYNNGLIGPGHCSE
jgi:hypothetical protein